jgi:uncharacterized protein YfaS (alpha-2-macroglobulin family)
MRSRVCSLLLLVVAIVALTLASPLSAQQPAAGTVKRPASASGTVIIPEKFLRRWDPVTVFFARDVGPAPAGPEDSPERLVTCAPAHPGAFWWIDARTLQFRPAEPWPPLQRFAWKADGASFALTTLMEPPVSSVPGDGATGLQSVEAITLTFREPLAVEALAQMLAIELRPLPGIGAGRGRFLKRDAFEIKVMERRARDDQASYVLSLKEPLPLGHRVIVRMRLALEDDEARSFSEVAFSTAEAFRLVRAGCRGEQLPLTPEGIRYSREQVLRCDAFERVVSLEFSSEPVGLGPIEARNLVRITPPVEALEFHPGATGLTVSGKFASDTLYRISLSPIVLRDRQSRPLDMRGGSELYLSFPRKESYLRLMAGAGVVERFGAQMVPVQGRGDERIDLRIYPVDPLDRSFWPFSSPVAVDESARPPGPGEEPEPLAAGTISIDGLRQQIRALSAPPLSRLVNLPLRKEGSAATFGLDLEPHLAHLAGKGQPGTYLIGVRRLDASSQRWWMRLQVTDLVLATLEEARTVRFLVTSLATAAPVIGASVKVEGERNGWVTVVEGTTDAEGMFVWQPPGETGIAIRRIVVKRDHDVLVLDASRPPERYSNNSWSPSSETWLQWTQGYLGDRGPQAETLCHIFTERPVYRPDETVHIKGWLRLRKAGTLVPVAGSGFVVVEGPGDLIWRLPATLSEAGGFYQSFAADEVPTGEYYAHFENSRGDTFGRVGFRMEAYRIPEFEINLHAPDRVPLDREFQVGLTATYYAGGRVAARPVRFRVTQFPYTWAPGRREGFYFSSDARFSPHGRFESSPEILKDETTDADGGASITLNPAIEPTAQPRSYVVEATVTGADDQTVTATRQIIALPPFVLALKVPRFLEKVTAITPQLLVLGPDDKPIVGQTVTVRLLHRQWHSVLQASDFSQGSARYLTDVLDAKIHESVVQSGKEPLDITLPIKEAGVYLVEVEAQDQLGRTQVISIDLYAGGEGPVTWAKPTSKVFKVTQEKDCYNPGENVNLVLQSPFQNGEVLAIVEAPEGNQYRWVKVEGGTATVQVPIKSTYVPEVPVHFVLMRGRVPGSAPSAGSGSDLGKPATMGATSWIKVNPVDNQVDVKLEHPRKARPAQKVSITVSLADPQGRPLAGEVTLWLVDQAVLALGREQRLDPLPDLITPVHSYLVVLDTRNSTFGVLPFAELPGGEGGEPGALLFERSTVRKNFKTVPYYNPTIAVGPSGTVTVEVELPDNLTNFAVRAKAACGPDRFGAAGSVIEVRLPVIVQPALPRFVRPGDRFSAAAIARVVEGEGGPGLVAIQVSGVELSDKPERTIMLVPNQPERVEFPLQVPPPRYDDKGELSNTTVTFRAAVERSSDGARDAFEVQLPIRDDRRAVTQRVLVDMVAGTPVALPEPKESARAGSLRRSVLVSDQPGLVRMAAGLDFLLSYPYGCTEQRVSRTRAQVALKAFRELLHQRGNEADLDRAVRDTLEWLPRVVDSHGLVAYWPGTQGYVSLTAWVVSFLVEAREAGYRVDTKLFDTLTRSLEQALRSDYSYFIDGESWAERAWALSALAQAGRFNGSYGAELARRVEYLDLESSAQVLHAFARSGDTSSATVRELAKKLWDGVVVRLYQGREIYGGLQDTATARSGLILPTESRTLAEISRALARVDARNARFGVLPAALVTLGRGDGWGSTNANAAALLALGEMLKPPFAAATPHIFKVQIGATESSLETNAQRPVAALVSTWAEAGQVTLQPGGAGAVVLRAEITYLPAADGSQAAAESSGFVVSREQLRIVPGDQPAERFPIDKPGSTLALAVGDVIEEHIQIVNPTDRHYVAIIVPLAAGIEPLNPNLATAPPEARTNGSNTLVPTYFAFLDDSAGFYYNTLPKGTYDFYFRTRAQTAGSFIQPGALAEMMYDGTVRGSTPGARVEVTRKP